MLKLLTVTHKELVLLTRDRTGLLVLFVMPVLLVLVLTLVQENVMELTGQKETQLLFLDLDGGVLGSSLRQQLADEHIRIVAWDTPQKNLADIQAAVANGEYQVGVVIPAGTTGKIQEEIADLLQRNRQSKKRGPSTQIPVHVFFDPGIMPGFRSGLTAQLRMALETLAMGAKIEALNRELENLLKNIRTMPDVSLLPTGGLSGIVGQPLLTLEDAHAAPGTPEALPYNPVQQNVPAWALFGMFFTAIPIAGALLQERKSGIRVRLATLPIPHLLLLSGKVLAYMGVCLCQFLLVSLIGSLLFPYIGLPAFTVSQHLSAVLVIVLCSSLAACGYGIFLGMACSTYEQASTVGATTVVAAAAIGGVMVPVYAMPQTMQRLSIISPLNWGLTAFHDLLVRGYSFPAILDDLGRLTLFFLLTILLAWKLARTKM